MKAVDPALISAIRVMPESGELRKDSRLTLPVVIILVLIVGLLGVLVRLSWLQIWPQGVRLSAIAAQSERPTYRDGTTLSELPVRGAIFDANGELLAGAWYEADLIINPWDFCQPRFGRFKDEPEEAYNRRCAEDLERRADFAASAMAEAIHLIDEQMPAHDIRAALTNATREGGKRRVRTVLLRHLEPTQSERLAGMIRTCGQRQEDFRSGVFTFEHHLVRTYPRGADCAQVVGIIGQTKEDPEVRGRTGLEFQLDQILTGSRGQLHAEMDGRRREFLSSDAQWVRPGAPASVHVTLRPTIQRFCIDALRTSVALHEAEGGTAVVLDARTGDILAAVSLPVVDPQNLKAGDLGHLPLGALTRIYEPGSIIKPILVGFARDQGALSWEEPWDCGGADGFERFGYRTVREYSANPAPLQTTGVLIRSSNVGAVRIGMERLGIPGMVAAFQDFDLFAPLDGTLYPGALAGYYDKTQAKREFDAGPSWPMGYALMLSPVAMARMYTAFATDGRILEPRLVSAIERGNERLEIPPRDHRALQPDVAFEVREVLMRVVEEGTAKTLKGMDWTVAAKTGTPKDTARTDASYYNPVICAIAPALDPEIVVTVMHHGIRGGRGKPYTGGSCSGPTAREIIKNTLLFLRVPKDR